MIQDLRYSFTAHVLGKGEGVGSLRSQPPPPPPQMDQID